MTRAALIVALALGAGCTETVGFLSIDIAAGPRSPAITCAQDPRRATQVTVEASCDGGRVQGTFAAKEGTVALSDVPIGTCTVTVRALNALGNVVLRGSTRVEIGRGNNTAQKIALVEEACDASCDPDGDKLPSSDEAKLRTGASVEDSDGDGVEDGAELMQCCTDPTNPADSKGCRLLIQRVEPTYGPSLETVLIKTATPVVDTSLEVRLGGQPLEENKVRVFDNVYLLGEVNRAAVLGEVKLTAGSDTDTYVDLFAVLREDPQRASDIDRRSTGATSTLMQRVVDLGYRGDMLFLLGEADGGAAILDSFHRVTGQSQRWAQVDGLKPVGLAVDEQTLLVLLRDSQGKGVLKIITAGPTLRTVAGFSAPEPVAVALEPSAAQVLFKDAITRLPLDAGDGGKGSTVSLPEAIGVAAAPVPGGALPPIPIRDVSCTGLTRQADDTFVACNVRAPCPEQPDCSCGLLLRAKTSVCLPVTGTPPQPAPCWRRSLPDFNLGTALGAPAVDAQAGRVYLRTRTHVTWAPLGVDQPLFPLEQFINIDWTGGVTGPRPMAFDAASGWLYLTSGPAVWRTRPRAVDPAERRGRPMIVTREGEEVPLVALAPDRRTLDLERRKAGVLSSLLTVCLERCPGCPCEGNP